MILHTPVLLNEVCSFLRPESKLIVDCTLGHGGHAMTLLSLAKDAKLIGFDVDEIMLKKAEFRIQNSEKEIKSSGATHHPSFTKEDKKENNNVEEDGGRSRKIEERVEYVHESYANIVSVLEGRKMDFILNDLGVNLEHFKAVERGFSIRGTANLDMRFDTSTGASAADILKTYSTDQLKDMFEHYADFSSAKAFQLAQHIVASRKQKAIITTQDFKILLNECGLGDKACTVIFQSLRIETNKEMDNLKKFLSVFPETLNSTGRCLIITYHSTEDRFVKQAFNALVATGNYKLVTKKAVQPNYKEVAVNRAARSAKLRILEKIN
ncbi:MAG: 16S rRNA (cytosine(1402)-N(4))-methyltransferase RsmH [candidate division SR1 bacterium]|nr:16S rRNA (cytosine(1402)-N(4))-methyltransferase RsmH [candidate division SR1 bacterium]